MSSNFLSHENKAMVWQFLSDAKAFSGIPEQYFERVKNLYESTLSDISKLDNTLVEKNKAVIAEMMNKLPYLKNSSLLRPLEEVKITVNNDFKNKQEEFISLVKHKSPTEPNFTDTTDEPLDTTVMNNMLNNMVASRERELNQVQPPLPEKNVQQLNNNSDSTESKKVSFETDFISRLKKVELNHETQSQDNSVDNKTNIINELKICITNQEKIMTQLNSILSLLE